MAVGVVLATVEREQCLWCVERALVECNNILMYRCIILFLLVVVLFFFFNFFHLPWPVRSCLTPHRLSLAS